MDTDLVEFCRRFFLGSPEDVERFQADPQRVLAEEGFTQVTPAEVHEALVLACEAPVDQGADVAVGGIQTTAPAPAPGARSGRTPSSAPAAAPGAGDDLRGVRHPCARVLRDQQQHDHDHRRRS